MQIVDDEGNYKMRLVRIGEVVDENSVTILSGLKPGERILVRGRN
jgi:multidrug efflux pump subunit AcrA (membrane-fusion protein)